MSAFDLAFETVWKAFIDPHLWHGTTSENAKKILEEGLDDYSFGSDSQTDAELYADEHRDRGRGPAILGINLDGYKGELLDPHDEGYDFGSDMGHYIMDQRVSPENISLYAMGYPGISISDWYKFLRQLRESDMLSGRSYPQIQEAYAGR